MAGSLNKVLLIGRLGADPEIKQMVNGKSVARLSLATSQSWKDKNTGEKKEKTEWHRIVVFNEGLVNVVQQYLKKVLKFMLRVNFQLENGKMKNLVKISILQKLLFKDIILHLLCWAVVILVEVLLTTIRNLQITTMICLRYQMIWMTKFHFNFYAKD